MGERGSTAARRAGRVVVVAGATGGAGGSDGGRLVLGVNLGRAGSRDELLAAARSAEADGFDVVTAADHLGSTSPFVALAAAAAVTERVRLRTYVLDAYFWNPALLARDVAHLDLLSGGRVDLGVGAGHMRHEHEDAGLPFPGHAERMARTEALVVEVRRRLADPEHRPAPVQRPVPLLLGVWGERGLRVAARHADVLGLTGLLQVPGERAGTFSVASSQETADRLGLLQDVVAEERDPAREPLVLDALVQRVVVDADPERAAAEVAGDDLDPTLLLDTPFFLFAASAQDALAELRRRRDAYGITQWMTHSVNRDAMAQVVALQAAEPA